MKMIRGICRETRLSKRTATATLLLMALIGIGASTATLSETLANKAPTVTLKEDWAAYTRCPVDSPIFLAADGDTNSANCIAEESPSGTLRIGNLFAVSDSLNVQYAVVLNGSTGESVAISPGEGSIVADQFQVPGGLWGVICNPPESAAARGLCRTLVWGHRNALTLSLRSAGDPENFNILGFDIVGRLGLGTPTASLPVEAQLESPFLGPECRIGSQASPIVIKPADTIAPRVHMEKFDADGRPAIGGELELVKLTAGTQADTTFTVPRASGCGQSGSLDGIIDSGVGLPATTGHSSIVLSNVTAYGTSMSHPETLSPNDGKVMASDWESAVVK
jgi:hypothetical protein